MYHAVRHQKKVAGSVVLNRLQRLRLKVLAALAGFPQRLAHFQSAIEVNPCFLNRFMNALTRGRVVTTISARIWRLKTGISATAGLFFPRWASQQVLMCQRGELRSRRVRLAGEGRPTAYGPVASPGCHACDQNASLLAASCARAISFRQTP